MSVWNLFTTLSTALLGTMAATPDQYAPNIEDILAVKQILIEKGKLPLELVDTIIDFAEYWVKTTTCRTNGEVSIHAGREHENKLLLRSYPLGYIPTKDNPTKLPMTAANDYPSIPSEPLVEPEDFPNNVTQEVIDYWTRDASPRGEFPCRKIVFTIKSHDQGWGGPPGCRGTYKGSSTWFDVGLETLSAVRDGQLPPFRMPESNFFGGRISSQSAAEESIGEIHAASRDKLLPYFSIPDPQSERENPESVMCTTRTINPPTKTRTTAHEPPQTKADFRFNQDPGLDCLQRNRTATRDSKEYVITWSCDDDIMDPDSVDGKKLDEEGRGRESANGEYVRNLKVGDVVTVWGKSRYLGWVNSVEEVKIDVYWAI